MEDSQDLSKKSADQLCENDLTRRDFLTVLGIANAALLLGWPSSSNAATTNVNLQGAASGFTYVDDVFSTFLYTGTGATKLITNGIDLANNGGLVWIKCRTNVSSSTTNNVFIDTTRGPSSALYSNTSTGATTGYLSSFNNNGFTLLSNGGSSYNSSSDNYAS